MSCSQPETSAASPHQWIIPFFSTPRANTLFHIDCSPPLPGKIWTAWNSSLSLSALQRTNQKPRTHKQPLDSTRRRCQLPVIGHKSVLHDDDFFICLLPESSSSSSLFHSNKSFEKLFMVMPASASLTRKRRRRRTISPIIQFFFSIWSVKN